VWPRFFLEIIRVKGETGYGRETVRLCSDGKHDFEPPGIYGREVNDVRQR
jgi:hypothetical protein